MRAILLCDTTSHEKRRDFEAVFGGLRESFFLHTLYLPCLQAPQADEIAGTTEGNLSQKQKGIVGGVQTILSQAPWLLHAEIAATRGWIGRETAEALALWHTDRLCLEDVLQVSVSSASAEAGTRQIQAPDALLAGEAERNGFLPEWQILRNTPVFILNDDSKTALSLVSDGQEYPLTFSLLDSLTRDQGADPDLQELKETVTHVAAYMRTAQVLSGQTDAFTSDAASLGDHAAAWSWYMETHANEALLGPDGSSIADLMGPHRTVRALRSLVSAAARHFGISATLDDLRIVSTSCVSATPVSTSDAITSTASVAYHILPEEELEHRLQQGGKLLLTDLFVCDPEQKQTVREHQESRTPETGPLLPREHALESLRRQMIAAGHLSAEDVPAQPSASFRIFDTRDTVALVLPQEASRETEAHYCARIRSAWGQKITVKRYDLEEVVHNPACASQLQACAAVCMVDPDLIGENGSRNDPRTILDFILLGLNREIDGTVGHAEWACNPTFVIGDHQAPESGAGSLHNVISRLYIHGRIKNPAQPVWITPGQVAAGLQDYLAIALVRPADDVIIPLSCQRPAPKDAATPATPGERPDVVALYGGAKPLSHPDHSASAHRAMDTVVGMRTTAVRTVVLEGEALTALGQLLGVIPPRTPGKKDSPGARSTYAQRLHAALSMMPGVRITRQPAEGGPQSCTLDIPVMDRPVVFVHGGGEHPYDSILPHAPTNNVMGTFAGGAYLAVIRGELVFVGTYGISTLPLMRLEGRPGTALRTSQFAVAPCGHIAERTLMTRFPFADGRPADWAIAIIGGSGIGTLQECLSFENPLILVAAADDPIARQISALRESVGYTTRQVHPQPDSFDAALTDVLGEVSAPPVTKTAWQNVGSTSPVTDWNALYPLFALHCSAAQRV